MKKYDELYENVRENEKNEKINRLIRNLYAQGLSEFTDYENAVNEMKKMVLNAPKNAQEKKYKELSEKMYYGKFELDNQTIFRIGIPSEYELFRAFDIYESDPDTWIKLIDFYFESRKVKQVTPFLIETLILCRIENRKVYLHILKKFNQLESVGNLNQIPSYLKFLKKYLSAFSSLGFINTQQLRYLYDLTGDGFKEAVRCLESLYNDLGEAWMYVPLKQIKDDIVVLRSFVKKNLGIMHHPESFKESADDVGMKINTTINTKNPVVDEFEKEHKKKRSAKTLRAELQKKYTSGIYRPVDVVDIWNNYVNSTDISKKRPKKNDNKQN